MWLRACVGASEARRPGFSSSTRVKWGDLSWWGLGWNQRRTCSHDSCMQRVLSPRLTVMKRLSRHPRVILSCTRHWDIRSTPYKPSFLLLISRPQRCLPSRAHWNCPQHLCWHNFFLLSLPPPSVPYYVDNAVSLALVHFLCYLESSQ